MPTTRRRRPRRGTGTRRAGRSRRTGSAHPARSDGIQAVDQRIGTAASAQESPAAVVVRARRRGGRTGGTRRGRCSWATRRCRPASAAAPTCGARARRGTPNSRAPRPRRGSAAVPATSRSRTGCIVHAASRDCRQQRESVVDRGGPPELSRACGRAFSGAPECTQRIGRDPRERSCGRPAARRAADCDESA